jgi:hypothetical protein
MLGLGSSARKLSRRVTGFRALCGATDERRRGEDPMFVLKGDRAEGGGREDFVLRSNLRLLRTCVGSGTESDKLAT